jgi:hypothetical protein
MKEAVNPAIPALSREQLNIDTTGWRVLHCRQCAAARPGPHLPPMRIRLAAGTFTYAGTYAGSCAGPVRAYQP